MFNSENILFLSQNSYQNMFFFLFLHAIATDLKIVADRYDDSVRVPALHHNIVVASWVYYKIVLRSKTKYEEL